MEIPEESFWEVTTKMIFLDWQKCSLHYGHFFPSIAREYLVLCLYIQIFPPEAKLLMWQDDYDDYKWT